MPPTAISPGTNDLTTDTKRVTIEKLVYGGDGLGRIDGQVTLVPYVLPDEIVSTRVESAKTGLLRGGPPEILESSPHRIHPRCEYFGTCGGCQYQHGDYRFQVLQKVAILRETLQRLGGIAYEGEVHTVAGFPWSYRNRVQLHLADGQSGFHRAGSHRLCAVDHCFISAPPLVDAIARIQEAAKRPEWPKFVRSLEFFTNDFELQINILESGRPVAARFFEWCRTFLPSLAQGAIDYHAAGNTFRVSGGSFFQVNRFLIEALVNEVVSSSAGETAIDLYAGVGLFSVPLARRFTRLDAVEAGGSASRDLHHNIERNQVNATVKRSSAESYLASFGDTSVDLMVVDPPRAGLGSLITDRILHVRPGNLKLVSCDPATLARDLKKLLEIYEIERMTLVDLFPQTYHFETVVHLRLK